MALKKSLNSGRNASPIIVTPMYLASKETGSGATDSEDLPKAEEKRRQYEVGKQMLHVTGYVGIGMEHFALPDADSHAAIHRNFMGYTAQKPRLG